MLNHIVMWKILDSAGGHTKEENIKLLFDGYAALQKIIPSIADAKLIRTSGGTADVILFTRFADEAELNAYINNPKHREFSEFCKSVRETRSSADYFD